MRLKMEIQNITRSQIYTNSRLMADDSSFFHIIKPRKRMEAQLWDETKTAMQRKRGEEGEDHSKYQVNCWSTQSFGSIWGSCLSVQTRSLSILHAPPCSSSSPALLRFCCRAVNATRQSRGDTWVRACAEFLMATRENNPKCDLRPKALCLL